MSNSDNRNALPARKDIDAKYKWRLEDLFADDSQWEALFTATSRQTKAARKYKGKLRGGDGKQLLAALKLRDRVSQDVEQLYVYARMRRDEDNANGVYQTLSARAEALMTDLMTEWAFFEPEVLGFAEELETMYRKTPELTAYRFLLDELLRQKEHVLSPAEEQLLAGAADALRTGHTVFTMFNNADLRFPFILDEDGARVQLSHGRYGTFLESADRNVRRRAFKALYAEYGKYRNTLASCYSGNVKTDVFYARARKYPDSLTASLDKDKVPVSVYDNLVESVHAGIGTLNRYLRMRKEMLGLARLHMYDLYVPLVQLPKKTYTFEEGRDIVLRALKPLGEDYVKDAEAAFRDGWIDVYENQGKTSGAYSWGCYTGHPYVLLNWQGRLDDIFTLAHELGHAMHSFYSNRSQPYHYAGYTIFVAEVASTVNENLLLHALLDTCTGKDERMYLINHYLEAFRTTVFRQTMFAEFERLSHAAEEKGEPLTSESLSKMYARLNRRYYGAEAVVDKEIALEWARIPHFYTAFYVYQYATGFSSAALIARNILHAAGGARAQDGPSPAQQYRRFLCGGGSDHPMELLKLAGVDLSTPEPVEAALEIFAEYVDKMEEALRG